MATTTLDKSNKDTFLAAFDQFERGTADAPAWLAAIRKSAISRFGDLGFPTTRHEQWRFTNVSSQTSTEYSPAEHAGRTVTPEQYSEITEWDAGFPRMVFVNGRYAADLSSMAGLPDGVRACSLAEAITSDRAVVESHLGKYAKFENEAFTALNTAFMADGLFLHVPKGVVIENPIHAVFVTTTGDRPLVTHPRNLIVAEKQSQLTVVESYCGYGDSPYFTNTVTEIVAADGAVVDHYKIQREGPAAFHKCDLTVQQFRSSNVSSDVINLGGRLVRNDMNARLDGEGAESMLNGLTVLRDEQHVDNHLQVDHLKPHCNSWEYFKGVYDDRSRGVFSGRILVAEGAQKTDAKQSNMSLLLSEEALVDSKPQLEIFANDVKCTHGATIGQIDDEAVFYLQSRGLDRGAARSLLTYAFAGESVGQIRIDPLREQMQTLLFTRLPHGELLKFGRPYAYSRDHSERVRSTDRRRET
ncbi:MAG: Fe-S cluster assembly protein SufD [Planctomycetota bacterium]|nr:Fe-S cluster assembly protein SufD [Planctomycetota bacterium]